jgi:hypothetical protein
VVSDDQPSGFGGLQQLGSCVSDLVNQHIRALRKANEVFAGARIAGDHNRMPCIVDSKAQRWLYERPVIDIERGDNDAVSLVPPAFLNFLDNDGGAFRRQPFVSNANSNVGCVRIL